MGWDMYEVTEQVARKEYYDESADYICDLCEEDVTPDEWQIICEAREGNWKIKKGVKYRKTKGLFEGEWETFRATIELDDICHKYNLYPDS